MGTRSGIYYGSSVSMEARVASMISWVMAEIFSMVSCSERYGWFDRRVWVVAAVESMMAWTRSWS